ncbi:MAG: glycoside hydrolase family 9 protein, partial [Verrucomicrobiales bacterium]|nr:glycoside hydrolase family 9 protein [Verrucomicrobiales bacterium]
MHYLVFAADSLPGAGALDNLGLPESGDGKSDLLQEAKWEADFLTRMQDADGGFYFLLYPKERSYEDDVLPDQGDPQVVWPKTTAATAAAVAALAQAGSSPLFRTQFPESANLYLRKAMNGWAFLERAMAQHGRDGSYQKISHYGHEFLHDDELAWAATELFLATKELRFERELITRFDPNDRDTKRWTWWRLYEGYGCAIRSYAFGATSGRVESGALNAGFLRKCRGEILAAAQDQARFAADSAYGTSFPDATKRFRSAGWYFSNERAFDLCVALQLNPDGGKGSRLELLDALMSKLNYEGGCNPVNMTYVTGLGWRRQIDIVHQYAQNDRRVLPPSGIPIGNIQAGFQFLHHYGKELGALSYPPDGAEEAPYPFYDRWGDSFNTSTEFVAVNQARSLASLAFLMAQTSIKTQPWRMAQAEILLPPNEPRVGEKITCRIKANGLDLRAARIVWETRDQPPAFGESLTFAPSAAGKHWIEA